MERSSGAAPPRQAGTSDNSSKGELLEVRVETTDGRASVVSLAGELDLSTIPTLEARLLEKVRNPTGVVVDLTRLSFIDSSGIGLLIKAHRAAEGGRLHTVVAPGSQVERVFELAGIDRVLPVFALRDEAVRALGGPAA